MLIKCEICGKEVQIEKKNVSFYARWLEIEPDKWICRDCEQKCVWPNIIQYKIPASYQSLKIDLSKNNDRAA
ncbi:MAG TPA: hypothetical protein VMV49_08965 [Candidatus Deferrimicrobium sp.]|nr:hypothetical protein [Candidatus Deferrimicrobium sp.]